MTAFYVTSFVAWVALAAIWKRSDWLNALIKVALFLMAAWAGSYVYSAYAPVIQAQMEDEK